MKTKTGFPWMLVLTVALAVGLIPTAACSVLDGEDRSDLEAAVEQMPKEDRHSMAAMVVSAKTRHWVEGRPKNDQMMTGECRHKDPGTGEWTPWAQDAVLNIKVVDMLFCLGEGGGYVQCLDILQSHLHSLVTKAWDIAKAEYPAGSVESQIVTECRVVVRDEYKAAFVPGATDDLNRVTIGEMVDWLLRQPGPPPGFTPSLIRALAPFVCALSGAGGWCGAASGPPGGETPIVISSGATGDYP